MKIVGGNHFAFDATNKEIATVKVTSSGTTFLVTYKVVGGHVIDGPNQGSMKAGIPLRFTLDSATKKNKLNMGFIFASPAEVAGEADEDPVEYNVEVTGDAPGSDTSRELVDGSFGIPTDNRQWRFFVS